MKDIEITNHAELAYQIRHLSGITVVHKEDLKNTIKEFGKKINTTSLIKDSIDLISRDQHSLSLSMNERRSHEAAIEQMVNSNKSFSNFFEFLLTNNNSAINSIIKNITQIFLNKKTGYQL